MQNNCLNCHKVMHGPICSECGQEKALPIKAKRVLQDIWSQFLELDFKFIRALRDIIIRPGFMINGYLTGKRISYTNPFKLLFFITTAYFLVIQYFDIKFDNFSNTEKDMGSAIAALLNYLIFITLIPTAYFYRLIYSKSKLNLAEAYVSMCYIWSGYSIFSICIAIVSLPITQYFIPIKVLVEFIYLVYVTQQIFKLKLSASIGKAILLFLGFFLSMAIVLGIVIFVSHIIQYEPLMVEFKKME